MFRFSSIFRQFHRQAFADSLGYSSAFTPASEAVVPSYVTATAVYSAAAQTLPRRRGHPERTARYKKVMRHISQTKREELGMTKAK